MFVVVAVVSGFVVMIFDLFSTKCKCADGLDSFSYAAMNFSLLLSTNWLWWFCFHIRDLIAAKKIDSQFAI